MSFARSLFKRLLLRNVCNTWLPRFTVMVGKLCTVSFSWLYEAHGWNERNDTVYHRTGRRGILLWKEAGCINRPPRIVTSQYTATASQHIYSAVTFQSETGTIPDVGFPCLAKHCIGFTAPCDRKVPEQGRTSGASEQVRHHCS